MKIKNNQSGVAHMVAILAVIVIVAIGLVGWKVWDNNRTKQNNSTPPISDTNNASQKEAVESEAQKPETKVAKKYTSFTVKSTGKLEGRGKCKSGEVLFARIYNYGEKDSYTYDCQGPLDAIQYVNVVLGQRTSSVVGEFTKSAQSGESATISNGVTAKKYSFTDKKKGHGTSELLPTKYVIYEVNDGKDFFYGVYWTGVGFNDEDYYLADFNEMMLKNWSVQ